MKRAHCGILYCLAFLSIVAMAEESPETVYKEALGKLQESQADHAMLMPAAKLLAQAADLYEKAGDEAKVTEVNACLYWAKKKFTLADDTAVKANPQISSRLDSATKEIPVDQAQQLLTNADTFAKSHADNQLLVAIRYFEVADRFKDTEAGRTAIDLSLKAMQKIGEKTKREAYVATATDGKVFIKSEPVGAEILLITKDGGKLETGKVTPSVVQVPVGFQSVELNLKGYKPHLMTFQVDGKSILKPDGVKLVARTLPVDVIFEEGWTVFVGGKPATTSGAQKPESPCTIELPIGVHQIALAKEGFVDISQRLEVKSMEDKISLEPKATPVKGKSLLLGSQQTAATPAAAKAAKAPSSLRPGLTLLEYHRLDSQEDPQDKNVPLDFEKPIGQPRITSTLTKWKFNDKYNATATGFIKITVAGDYIFNSNSFWDRNALVVNGVAVCPFRDGEQKRGKINLPVGMIPIKSIGYVETRGSVEVQWQPPGQLELTPIPNDLLFSEAK